MVLEELGIGGEYISSNIGKIYIDAFNGSLYVGVQKEHLKDAENIISEHLLKDFEIEKNGIFYKYKDFFIVGYEIPEEIHFAEKLSARINSLK